MRRLFGQSRSRFRHVRISKQMENLESRQLMHAGDLCESPMAPSLDNLAAAPAAAVAGNDNCIEFEDLAAVSNYHVGDTFLADNSGFQAKITGEPFTWSNGMTTVDGVASVSLANLAGGVGQDLAINNILLNFQFNTTPTALRVRFGEYGGNLNLEINGDFRNFDNFQDIDGAVIGGTNVSVPVGGMGNDAGVLLIHGTINSFKLGGQELWIDDICVRDAQQAELDFGDAPDQPYPTLAAHQGARHRVVREIHLGKSIEPELDGQPTVSSQGDDQVVGSMIDDEDGVTFLSPLIPGQFAKVEVNASVDGWLNAWMDFNRNGAWESGTAEHLFAGEAIHAGNNILSIFVPAGTIPSPNRPVYSRWRFSTSDRFLKPEQSSDDIPNGEVEDHPAIIREGQEPELDWGDAPDKPYPTLGSHDGARHRVNPDVHLGRRIDSEPDGQPSVGAQGDDQTVGVDVDDEDGVNFLTPLIPGQEAKVEVVASVQGWLNAWIDFNRDGNWTTALPEQIFAGQFLNAGANVLSFMVPADAEPGPNSPTYSRWRFSTTDRDLKPEHSSRVIPDGEVEDHLVFIREGEPQERLDWGDAPDQPYRTLRMHGGAVHRIERDVFLGAGVDPEADGQPHPLAEGDDLGGADDEDGIHFLTPLIAGQNAMVEVVASKEGWLNAWIDFNRNGVWETGTAEEIFVGQPVAAGSNVFAIHIPNAPAGVPLDATFSRWRYSTTNKVLLPFLTSPEGTVPNGEVEDHRVKISPPQETRFDFGDAPDRPYPTTLAFNGARHAIDPKIYLGDRIDAEADGQPTFLAKGDDANLIDDEDGVKFLVPMLPGHDAKVEVVASTDGKLDAWVDFDQNGEWTDSEQIAISTPLGGGANTVGFFVPKDAIPHPTRPVYARFRFSTEGGLAPKGEAKNGEVEDYSVLHGDLNDDGTINDGDINRLCRAIHAGAGIGDLNGDGVTNDADMDFLIHDVLGTHYGDANLDGLFNSSDLIEVFIRGEYEDGIPNNSDWKDGDWDCDGDFNTGDMVKAFQDGGYSAAARHIAAAVAEEAAASENASEEAAAPATADDAAPQISPVDVQLALVDSLFGDDEAATGGDDHQAAVDELFALLA